MATVKFEEILAKLLAVIDEKKLTIKNVTDHVDLSYRMVNDWDNRNILSADRDGERGWRKFSVKDIIKLAVIKNLRDLGIPLHRLKPLVNWLNTTIVIEYALYDVIRGFNCFIHTNLKDHYDICREDELRESVSYHDNSFIYLRMNQLINDIFQKVGLPTFKVRFFLDNELYFKDGEKYIYIKKNRKNEFKRNLRLKLDDLRCKQCHKKLGEVQTIEGTVKCPKCKHLNKYL